MAGDCILSALMVPGIASLKIVLRNLALLLSQQPVCSLAARCFAVLGLDFCRVSEEKC